MEDMSSLEDASTGAPSLLFLSVNQAKMLLSQVLNRPRNSLQKYLYITNSKWRI